MSYSWQKINDTPEDRAVVQAWLDNDPYHKQAGVTVSMLFTPDTEAFFVLDHNHNPIMAVRKWKAYRFAMQFDPSSPYKTAHAAHWVVQQMQMEAQQSHCLELACMPGGKAIQFAERLGFTHSPQMSMDAQMTLPWLISNVHIDDVTESSDGEHKDKE